MEFSGSINNGTLHQNLKEKSDAYNKVNKMKTIPLDRIGSKRKKVIEFKIILITVVLNR